jgi:hypothetical protein
MKTTLEKMIFTACHQLDCARLSIEADSQKMAKALKALREEIIEQNYGPGWDKDSGHGPTDLWDRYVDLLNVMGLTDADIEDDVRNSPVGYDRIGL